MACLVWLLVGCMAPSVQVAETNPYFQTPFVPVTQVPGKPTPGPTPTATAGPTRAASSPSCTNNLKFIDDATIPDRTRVEANSTLDKRWEVENNGTCNWDERYHIRRIAGPDLGVTGEQELFPTRANNRATIRMIFRAPAEAGTYRSAWQAVDPQGTLFGEPFFIEIEVKK